MIIEQLSIHLATTYSENKSFRYSINMAYELTEDDFINKDPNKFIDQLYSRLPINHDIVFYYLQFSIQDDDELDSNGDQIFYETESRLYDKDKTDLNKDIYDICH